jgi:hypothetical protein
MIKPKEITLEGKRFVISKFPATDGREILVKYFPSGIPKFGDYKTNEECMFKMMNFVKVITENNHEIILSTKQILNNHVEDAAMLLYLEWAILEYNFSFFLKGRISTLSEAIALKVPEWTLKMLTGLSDLLSKVEKPPSTN